MTYISIGMYGTFRDIGVIVQKFKNYLNKLQKLFIRNFSIVCGHCGVVSPGQKLSKSVFTKHWKVIFLMLGLWGPIFAIAQNCHIQGLISPETGELHPSNCHRWLSHRGRFRKCNEIAERMWYVGGGAPRKWKKSKSPILLGLWG